MKRRSIKSLEGELKRLKRTLHNNNMNNIAKEFQKDFVERMPPLLYHIVIRLMVFSIKPLIQYSSGL